jgi:hypothetical protein
MFSRVRAPRGVFITCLHHLSSSPVFITCLHHLSSSPVFITCLHHLSSSPVFITFGEPQGSEKCATKPATREGLIESAL